MSQNHSFGSQKTITKTMENNDVQNLTHIHLVRLDDVLEDKLMNHIEVNDTTIAGTVRQSLRQFFENEDLKEEIIKKEMNKK